MDARTLTLLAQARIMREIKVLKQKLLIFQKTFNLKAEEQTMQQLQARKNELENIPYVEVV